MNKLTMLIGALAVAAAACGGADDTTTTTPADTTAAPTTQAGSGQSADLVANSTWNVDRMIVAGTEIPIVPGSTPTVQFSGNTLTADAGCNSIFGTVAIGDGTIRVTDVGMTEMACEPAALMTQENQLASLLLGADVWSLEAGRLTVGARDGSGAIELVAPIDRPAVPLAGTTWLLDTLVEGEAASSVIGDPTMLIDGDTVSGTTGCNTFTGFVGIDGASIRFTEVTWTEIGCEVQLMRQEQFVLETLMGATSFEIDGDRLTINAPGNALVYRAG